MAIMCRGQTHAKQAMAIMCRGQTHAKQAMAIMCRGQTHAKQAMAIMCRGQTHAKQAMAIMCRGQTHAKQAMAIMCRGLTHAKCPRVPCMLCNRLYRSRGIQYPQYGTAILHSRLREKLAIDQERKIETKKRRARNKWNISRLDKRN